MPTTNKAWVQSPTLQKINEYSIQFSGIKYIHSVVEPSYIGIPKHFHHPPTTLEGKPSYAFVITPYSQPWQMNFCYCGFACTFYLNRITLCGLLCLASSTECFLETHPCYTVSEFLSVLTLNNIPLY